MGRVSSNENVSSFIKSECVEFHQMRMCRVSSNENGADVRNPRYNRTTARLMKTGGNSIQTIHSRNSNNHVVGITNGKTVGIGGVLGAKEGKAIGDSLRQGLRKALPFANNIKQNYRVPSTGKGVARKSNVNTRQTHSKKHVNTIRKNTVPGRARTSAGSNLQRSIAAIPTSATRVRLNKMAGNSGAGSGNTKTGTETHSQKQMASGKAVVKNAVRGSATGITRKTANSKTRQARGPSVRGASSKSRSGSSLSSNSRGKSRSSSMRGDTSQGSSNGRNIAVATNSNQNGKIRNNSGNTRFPRNQISDGNKGRNSRHFYRNNGQNFHNSARFDNGNSAGLMNGNNRMQTSQRRYPSFHVTSGMQSNIRRRTGGIPNGISNSGKRVVVQNGRRIIISPSQYTMQQHSQNVPQQHQNQRQVRLVGEALEGGLESMDIDNIIGLASKIASVKLANSVLSSLSGQEGTPQLSRFLINSELDIVPELIVPASRQVIQAPRRPRHIVTIKQNSPAVVQSPSSQVRNEIKVAQSGYGTPVLVRSGGDIQFSRVDQTGTQISSVIISHKIQNVNNPNKATTVKTSPENGQNIGTKTGTGNSANGGTSKQAPEPELEMEMEQEGLSTTTTIAPKAKTDKPLLPPTTTVANSVLVT
ncbi:putative uncharacterized protein DDB_G0286901 [Ylistrum balloti]|uniref:putative uncharacterized protein DDB_G0286901 n=1 Tax=Ylistrum balloti TaxID=509963 RepID=UPI002905D13C|nr:putative uncharacterized protein DDB_G0286901 [Ylistrum balloti]